MTQSGSLSFDSYSLADYFVITDDAQDPQLQQRASATHIGNGCQPRMHPSNRKTVELRAPGITTVALLFFIAVWALAIGVLRIVATIRLRKEITGEFWVILSGIASVVFAFLVLTNPAAGALAIAWLIGWYAIFLGATLVMLSIKLHNICRLGDMPRAYRRAA